MKPESGLSMEIADELFQARLEKKFPEGPYPYSGQWELTCRCNLKCVMCYTDCFNTPDRIRQELPYPEITRILDELHEAGCLHLCLTGGEPLSRPDFLDIYTYAKKKGFLLTLFTNGTLITPKIADHWAAFRPYMIEVSFHGLRSSRFDRITQVEGSYERCMRGIRLLLERNLPLTLKSLGMTLNKGEILRIKQMAESLGGNVQYKFGSDLRENLNGTTAPFRFQLSPGEIAEIEQGDAAMRKERIRQDELERREPAWCGGGLYKFHIDAYGQLHLCSNNRKKGYNLRRGSFREGFYEALPAFPCSNRTFIPEARLLPRSDREALIGSHHGPS